MNEIKEPVEEVSHAINTITVHEKIVNGTELLIIYYCIILFFFIMDLIFEYRSHVSHTTKTPTHLIKKGFFNLYLAYRKYGFFTLNTTFFVICIIIIIYNIGFNWRDIIGVTFSFLIFVIFMRIVTKLLVNRNSYENDTTVRSIGIISDILLGNYLCYYMSFITAPDLLVTFVGLCAALLLCFFLMLRAIFNPQILLTSTNRVFYSQSFGIMKGMLAVLICMLTTLFMMLYACYVKSPDFFAYEYQRQIDAFDLVYFLIVSFTTIGYGDITPVRYEGLYYSQFTAILIGCASIFTTTCFVAAVVSTANSLAENRRKSTPTPKVNAHLLPRHPMNVHKETIINEQPRRKAMRKNKNKKPPLGL